MKTRTDFVSNSSSCSFVIKKNASKAAKMFLEDFGKFIADGMQTMGESMNIGYKLASKHKDEFFEWQSPCQFVSLFSDIENDDENEKLDADDIDELSFECDDYDSSSVSYLTLMYRYFDKFGFSADASDSEHEFLDGNKTFLEKIFERLESSNVSKHKQSSKKAKNRK